MTTPDGVLALAEDAVAAWKQIRAQANGLDPQQALGVVRGVLAEYALLPSDLTGRLLRDPIRG